MVPLDEALAQISDIRGHLVRTEVFRGYRSATVAFSAVVAVGTAGLQAVLIPDPARATRDYLILWVGAAALCLIVTAVEMSVRYARSVSPLAARHACLAVEQFLPCVVAGALLTAVLFRYASEALWMLPGLWAILFSLGIFASWRLLPRQTFLVAIYYLLAGVLCLAVARGDHSFSPWAMGGTFGIGQGLAAAVLYHTLERSHERA
jgi:hypothetical protein